MKVMKYQVMEMSTPANQHWGDNIQINSGMIFDTLEGAIQYVEDNRGFSWDKPGLEPWVFSIKTVVVDATKKDVVRFLENNSFTTTDDIVDAMIERGWLTI